MHTPRKHPTEQLQEFEGGSVAHRRRKQPTTTRDNTRAPTVSVWKWEATMEQHHNGSPPGGVPLTATGP